MNIKKKKYKLLSIDESGKASYNHQSREFALVGVIIDEDYKTRLRNKLAKVSKKYLGVDEFAIHYSELIRKRGVYSALRDNNKEIQFWIEILNILNNPKIIYRFIVIDKEKAKERSWISKTIVERAYAEMVKGFIKVVKKEKMLGKICTESDPSQDACLISVHNSFQSVGSKQPSITGGKYRKLITSLSLVNKNNLDPEIQIADLLGYTVRLKHRLDKGVKTELTATESKKLRLVERVIQADKDSYITLP